MFKNGPFHKGKEGSKNIVGRVVEVEGKGVDENHNSNNSVKSSNSITKSTISSVSRIFGASPFKKTSTTRTPGRKLLKKLICTPGRSRSFPDTSASELDDFGVYIPNNHSTGITLARTTSSEETRETTSCKTSNFGRVQSSPPRLGRILLEEDDTNSNQINHTKPMTESPERTQNYQISNSVNSSKRVENALVTASDFNNDMIFLTNSYSSDEYDHMNKNEVEPMSTMNHSSTSPYSSPQQYERHSSPSNVGHMAMKSPGISIPTPAVGQQRETSNGSSIDDFSRSGLSFPHALRNIDGSPADKMNDTTPNPKKLFTQFEGCEDDDAFLPDDFVVAGKQDVVTFTQEQVERKIREAKREERLILREQHEKEMEECQSEFEKMLMESGSQWKHDAEEQDVRYQKLLKEERHKVSLKHHELINNAQCLQDVKETSKELEAERELLNLRVKDLEKSEEKLTIAASINEANNTELESLRNDKINAESRILELESELSKAVDPLKREKETAVQKAAELSMELRNLTESSDCSQNQLEEALKEISLLRGQLAELPSVDPEEIRTSKLEVENLRNLRAEDEKEIHALQNQLGQIVYEHRDAITPQKKGKNSGHFETPCVGEIDMLRVDNDKAQDQLKSMGKVLKRYKTERDDLKKIVEELEQRQVQTIEIAVKQATLVQKEKIQLLTEEKEALRQEPKDIGEKMIEEMKGHMEHLKREHEEEIVRLREILDNEIKNAEHQRKLLKAQFEMESKELKENYEKKIESLIQEMQQLRENKIDELSLVKSSSKEEIDILQVELRHLKINFESEKTDLLKTKSREREALEGQIKAMNEMHNEELELVGAENREEVDTLKKKINELEMDLDAKSSSGALTEDIIKKMKSNFEDSLNEVKGKAKSDKDQLLTKVGSLKSEKDAETAKARKFEVQVGEIQAQNAAQIGKVRDDYDRQIREVKSEHARESDELLTQLDLIEAETAQRFKNAEAAVTEKDAVITALGSQLADSESRSASIFKECAVLKQEIESLRSDLEVVTASNEVSQKGMTKLLERHSKEIEDQIALREEACNEAREDTIALAEGQLAERQEYYQALKRELDNAQSKISVLERDLRFATKELEEMGRRHEGREADLRDEIAQSKAAIATKEANLIRSEKVHQAELDRSKAAERAMKSKFEESQATSNSIQKALASLVTEKQRLEQELAEVTAISEELATLCEMNKLM